MELAGTTWGPHSGPSAKIVFLHGMGGTGKLWRPIAAALEDEFSIFAPDQRGHGGSRFTASVGGRIPPSFTPLDYGRDLVESLGVRNHHPAWIVGHSMGVRSACALAHLRPEWIRGLVLVDLGFSGSAGGGMGEELAGFLKKLPKAFPSRLQARDFMEAECPDSSIGQYLMAVSESDPSTGEVRFPFDHGALIETIHAARDTSVGAWVREAGLKGTPVLVLRGSTSGVWSREAYEAERVRFLDLPNVRFEEFEGAGHGLPFEKRIAFVERLKRFIETRP